jgi:hypothetical protein
MKKRPVVCSDGREFDSITEAAAALGVQPSVISRAISSGKKVCKRCPLKVDYVDRARSNDWNRSVESSAKAIAATFRSELERLQRSDNQGHLSETIVSSLKAQCRMLTTTLCRVKTP